MPDMQRTARVPYSAQQMLDLVNDIEGYPEFLRWCRDSRIERADGATVEAALDIGIGGFRKTMRTRNSTVTHEGGGRVDIDLIEGPLERLHGRWTFTAIDARSCDIELSLDYGIPRTPFGRVIRALFDEIASTQLNAFIRRAEAVYGRR